MKETDGVLMAKAYVNFSVSGEVVAKTVEALQLAKQNGSIRKGVNEVTKSVERSLATFVVLAEDVEPEEVVMHIPKLCEQKKIAYSFVPTKEELGKAIGLTVPCAAISVENQGSASSAIKEIVSKITGKSQKAEPAQQQAPAQEKKIKEKAAPQKKESPKEKETKQQ
jgi:large subunit ribosomal protein L7Ae